MAKTMYQCCYTNLTQEVGGKIQSGWQTVAVSKDIPSEAYRKCEQFQKVNSEIQDSMKDENGEILNLLEIYGDNKFVYVMRTQYGLQDRLGRRNMFSHAYILLWEEVIQKPNDFLKIIDKVNFSTDENAALQLLEKQDLEMHNPCSYTIKQAMETAGLKAENYPELIRCVYTKISDRRLNDPLYIQCDSEEQMRALLFCIYYGLPYYLRKKLGAASAAGNSTEKKHIIFSRAADRRPCHFDPKSGDNTILSDGPRRKLERYGFIDYVARNTSKGDYFAHLAKEAVNLGDPSASNKRILKIAHKRLTVPDTAQYEDSDLDELLSDALLSDAFGSAAMCDYIVQLLNRVKTKKYSLTDEMRSRLAAWKTASDLSEAQSQELEQLEVEFENKIKKEREAVKAQIEEEYTKSLEDYRKKQEAAEKEWLTQNLSQLENYAKATLESEIEEACKRKMEELIEPQKKQIKEVLCNLVDKIWDEKAIEDGKDKEAATLDKYGAFQSLCKEIFQYVQKKQEDEVKKARQEIEKKVREEQEKKEKEARKKIEQDSEQSLENNIQKQKMILDGEMNDDLQKKYEDLRMELERDKSPRLKELTSKRDLALAIEDYEGSYVKTLSQDEILQELEKLQEDKLLQYLVLLSKREDGKEIVSTYCDNLLQEQPLSWETLFRILAASESVGDRPEKLNKELDERAWKLYCQSLDWTDGAVSPDLDQYKDFLAKFGPPEQAEKNIQKAKSEFWKRMSFARFSMDTFPEYSKMGGDMDRSRMFSEFYAIINDLPTTTEEEEDFLNKVQTFFSDFHEEIGKEREKALALLEKTVGEQYDGNDVFLMKWVHAFVMTDSEELCNQIFAVRSALYEYRYDDLIHKYDQISKYKLECINDLKRVICDIILANCDKRDSSEQPVPLDVWLLTAGDEIEKSFDVFNERTPAILQCSSSEVVRNSSLMKTESYLKAAEEYSGSRQNKEYKTVKKWMNEAKQLIKSGGNKKRQSGGKKKGEA